MFDFPAYDSAEADNSEMNVIKTRDRMNPIKTSITSCPSILTGMSHEMRTHMNAIVAFSFLLKENCTRGSENEEYSNQILNSCEQLIGLFDSFLDNAVLNTGSPAADARTCKLDNILNDLLPEFRETLKKQNQNELELITDKCYLDSSEVSIDKNKIFRVLRSLFQVSMKCTNSGYIKIGYRNTDDLVTFYVLDSGQGYFKCKEFLHTNDLNESLSVYNDIPTAINITLAKKLIQILGGSIWIESNGLSGTGTYFSVPLKKVAKPDITINKYVNTMISI